MSNGNDGAKHYTADDFAHSPFVLFYEITRACDLLCKHCRACAQPNKHPNELTAEQSRTLIGQIASFPKPPVLIFTGGDPMKRDDVYDLVSLAVSKGVSTAMTPSATPLVTREALTKLKEAGLSRLAVSLDGIDARTHDEFRGVPGSFDRTLEIMREAREIGLPLQVNTTITNRNVDQVDPLAEMLEGMGIVLWSVFFLVPVGRGLAEQRVAPAQYEQIFERLYQHSITRSYGIKTTEAPHYRRFVLQRNGNPQHQPGAMPPGRIQRAPLGVNDGKGTLFVSHTGRVYPSGFLPIDCGKFPEESIIDIYQKSELFNKLRNPDLFHGKCGCCEYRQLCGGSRARAYALTRDPLGSEIDCGYLPLALQGRENYAQCE